MNFKIRNIHCRNNKTRNNKPIYVKLWKKIIVFDNEVLFVVIFIQLKSSQAMPTQ